MIASGDVSPELDNVQDLLSTARRSDFTEMRSCLIFWISATTLERKNLSSGEVDRGGGGGTRDESTGDERGWQAWHTLDEGAGGLLANLDVPPDEIDGLLDETDGQIRAAGEETAVVFIDGRKADESDKFLVDGKVLAGWSELAVRELTA